MDTGEAPAWTIDAFENTSSGGNNYIVGFGFRTGDATPATNTEFFRGIDGAGSDVIRLRLETDGAVSVIDENALVVDTTPAGLIGDDEWHFFELYWEIDAVGDYELFVDDQSLLSGTGDFHVSTTAMGSLRMTKSVSASGPFYFDDIYFLSGATVPSERLRDAEVYGYRHSVTGVTPDAGGGGTSGVDLDVGNWQSTDDSSDATEGEYTGSGDRGTVDWDGPGSSPDSEAVGADIQGMKLYARIVRQGGGASTHAIFLGNSGQGDNASSLGITVTTAITNFMFVKSDDLPTEIQNIRAGFGLLSGNQDILMHDGMVFLLLVPGLLGQVWM